MPCSFVVASSACSPLEAAHWASFSAYLAPERTSLKSKGSSTGLSGSAAVVNSMASSGGPNGVDLGPSQPRRLTRVIQDLGCVACDCEVVGGRRQGPWGWFGPFTLSSTLHLLGSSTSSSAAAAWGARHGCGRGRFP